MGSRTRRQKMIRSGLELTLELPLTHERRMCARCRRNEVYQDIATLDLCEPCIARLVEAGE